MTTTWLYGCAIRTTVRLALLAFLVVFAPLRIASQASGGSSKDAGIANGYSAPTEAEVNRAISLATGYLERACDPDGRFAYSVAMSAGEQSEPYNIVRHAGAIYALTLVPSSSPDDHALDAALRAASFLRSYYLGPGERPDQLVVWSRPQPNRSIADLGATGLALVALAAIDKEKPNAIPLEDLEAMGHFLLFLQRSDGSFVSKYRAGIGPDENFNSLYYPGEAALGLISLYEIDRNPEWLNA